LLSGQVAYGWQLSQKAYVLDNLANNYFMTAVISNHIRTFMLELQPTTTLTPILTSFHSTLIVTVRIGFAGEILHKSRDKLFLRMCSLFEKKLFCPH